jgi:hypothetical protein
MTITFENDSDVIVYALEKIISFARDNQYLFVANCAWWIAGVIGLESGLVTHIDNLEIRRRAHRPREISNTPRDIMRLESIDPEQIRLEETIIQRRNSPEASRVANTEFDDPDYIPDPLRRTRKGNINPIPLSKKQKKKARQAERRKEIQAKRFEEKRVYLQKARQAKRQEGIQIKQREEKRARIIEYLMTE